MTDSPEPDSRAPRAPAPAGSGDVAGLDRSLEAVDGWGAEHVAVAVVGRRGILAARGDLDRTFRWASITKVVTAIAAVRAFGRWLEPDEPTGPEGSTVRHLLAHASGLPFEGRQLAAPPGRTRIYSNTGYDDLGESLGARSGLAATAWLDELALGPLGLAGARLVDRPSQGLHGTLGDLAALGGELLAPRVLSTHELGALSTVAFPGLAGWLPGVARFDPCDWGLGPEIRGRKTPHWTGTTNSPRTFGHFGGAGTFLWVDPDAGLALAGLTDRDFGPWALAAWPALSDAVLAAVPAGAS